MSRTALYVIGGVAVFIAFVVYSTMGLRQHRVEVCVTYQGRSSCRTASASTKQQALRTAQENACALITSGMTDSMACGSTQPASVKWLSGE